MNDVLKSGYYKFLLRYNNIDWLVDEVIKLENKLVFFFKKTREGIIMTEEDKEDYRNHKICRFCEKHTECNKVRDHCHLIGKYRGVAHSKCTTNVTQKQSSFIHFVFHNYDCHMFCKKLVGKKHDKVDFDIIPKTNEEYISET